MRQKFIIFPVLLLASNSINGLTNQINHLFNNQNIQGYVDIPLYNNYYQALDNKTDYIINQAKQNNSYYSYNLSILDNCVLSDNSNPKEKFLVNDQGNLVYNPKEKINNQADRIILDNYKTEIIKNLKIVKINNETAQTYNQTSRSKSDKAYFIDNYDSWNYIQLGNAESVIDISSQLNSNKIENYTGLSEPWALYYVAKAQIGNKITQTVANNLIDYFFQKSSLNGKLTTSWIHNMLNLLITNNQIFNYLRDIPYYISTKNCMLNLVTDSNNNLIKISCQLNNSNIKVNPDYQYTDTRNHGQNENSWNHTITKWTDYANSWDIFQTIYPKINLNNYDYQTGYQLLAMLGANWGYHWDEATLDSMTFDTNNIPIGDGSYKNVTYSLYSSKYYKHVAYLELCLFRDSNYLYFKWFFWQGNMVWVQLKVHIGTIILINKEN